MELLFVGAETSRALHDGALGDQVDGFVEALRARGYARASIGAKLLVLSHLTGWLERRGLVAHDLDRDRIRQFLRWHRRRHQVFRGVEATTAQLLCHLQTTGVLPLALVAKPLGAAAEAEERYATYLREERGLARATLANYIPLVHQFLVDRFGKGLVELGQLRADDAPQFVRRHASAMSPGRAKLLVTALRSFLRFLHLRGETATDLAPSVPTVADWRLAKLPKFIPVNDVHRLLRACDRRTATGRRDYAVMLLLARLGLRACEVVSMTLDDINWDGGEVTIRGKGGRHDHLPMPDDVGKALVEYLRRDRCRCNSRRVFLCLSAPRRGFSSSVAICTLVRRAIDRAGLVTPTKGAHLLRHSLATDLLRRGASLAEIGELLRHRSPETTALYAKVDFASLREIAQPWPGGAP